MLAGVNGAGKSSIGGFLLERAGLAWFNPDTYARNLADATGCQQVEANAAAWAEGMRRLDEAVANSRNHAFETTLGGNTVPRKILAATTSHDVLLWFCGLDSPEHHIARVRSRVAAGGHDIPDAKIRERYPRAMENLIGLMPHLARLQVYDNSQEVPRGAAIPDPLLVLAMADGSVRWPVDAEGLRRTPQWAKPLMEAALTG